MKVVRVHAPGELRLRDHVLCKATESICVLDSERGGLIDRGSLMARVKGVERHLTNRNFGTVIIHPGNVNRFSELDPCRNDTSMCDLVWDEMRRNAMGYMRQLNSRIHRDPR